jgi:hypothetical protein
LRCNAGETEKNVWTDLVRSDEVFCRVKEQRNIVHTINRREADCTDYILRMKCILKHVIEAKIQVRIYVMGRRERKHKQLLGDLKERR